MGRLAWLLGAAGVASGARVVEYATYTTSEGVSQGVLAYDDSRCTAASKCPAVMIVPDWTGIDDYEISRACLIADQGYVAFVADIYGLNRTDAWPANPGMPHWSAAAGAHRSDPGLFMEKMTTGMAKMSTYPFVDTTKLAAMGYCFGATGVINLVMHGHDSSLSPSIPSSLLGVVGYHASSNGVQTVRTTATSAPKLMLFQGLRDGAFSYAARTSLETELEKGPRSYQLSVLGSDVGHGYTNHAGSAFHAFADKRAWEGTLRFFEELFVPGMDTPQGDPGNLTDPAYDSAFVTYTADGVESRGYVVANKNTCTAASPCPGVLVVQDWTGMDEYEMRRAELVAGLGYVAFAADIYGVNTPKATQGDWAAAATAHNTNATKYMRKIYDAFQAMMDQPHVDKTKLAAIGYCFGGTGVINLGLIGSSHANYPFVPPGGTILGLAGYHAGTSSGTVMALQQGSGGYRPKVLVLSGATDSSNAAADMYVLEDALDNVTTEYEVQRYGSGVQHSFTDWHANFAPSNIYVPLADLRSWESTKRFLMEIFDSFVAGPSTIGVCGVPVPSPTPAPPAPSAGSTVLPLLSLVILGAALSFA